MVTSLIPLIIQTAMLVLAIPQVVSQILHKNIPNIVDAVHWNIFPRQMLIYPI